VHGSADQIVPIDAAGRRSVEILPQGTLLVYEGAPHGLPSTHKDRLNKDLLAFLRGRSVQ
jgi:non-heme chloroperoxidase